MFCVSALRQRATWEGFDFIWGFKNIIQNPQISIFTLYRPLEVPNETDWTEGYAMSQPYSPPLIGLVTDAYVATCVHKTNFALSLAFWNSRKSYTNTIIQVLRRRYSNVVRLVRLIGHPRSANHVKWGVISKLCQIHTTIEELHDERLLL